MSLRLIPMAALAVLISGCATPTVISPVQTSDVRMSCPEIEVGIDDAQQMEQAAREDRGVTPLNVAAAVFFWPALVGTYYNTEQAIEAAEARQRHLWSLHAEYGCNG